MIEWDVALFFAVGIFSIASFWFTLESKKIVHSIVYLAFFFLGVSGLFALLDAGFFSIAQVLVFVGGFVVLLILAIMLAREASVIELAKHIPLKTALVSLLLGLMISSMIPVFSSSVVPQHASVSSISASLFDQYAVVLDLTAFLLLSAVFGAVYLIRRGEQSA